MSDSLTEAMRESDAYQRSQQRFDEMLRRRDELKSLLRAKYPEVMELLETYYAERDWH